VYGQSSSITSGYFVDLCKEHLDPKDFALLESCSLNPFSEKIDEDVISGAEAARNVESTSLFIDSWRNWEKALRLNLAKIRAQNLKRDFVLQGDVSSLDAASIAKSAAMMDSPLEAEMFLDKARWDYIDSLEGFDNFSENVIFAYHLKLSINERYAQFKEDEGFAEYKRLYASIINQASGDEAKSTSNVSGEPK
jgi:hypothetical protein